MDEPVKHIAKWPWLAAVAFLTLVVLVGFYASDRARNERLREVGAVGIVTTLADAGAPIVSTTVAEPPAGAATGQAPVPTTSAEPAPVQPQPAASECSADTFAATVRASGRVDESAARSTSVERFNCASGYAYARLTSDVGPANAYFEWDGSNYQLLALGTAVDLSQYGVPADVASQLQ